MSKSLSRRLCKPTDNSGWKQALNDAEEKLKKAKNEVSEWEAVIRTCRKQVEEGAPWPGEEARYSATNANQ